MQTRRLGIAALAAGALACALSTPSQAAGVDEDQDGMPNRWEQIQGLDPDDAADALEDSDADGLLNLTEFRVRGRALDEDEDDFVGDRCNGDFDDDGDADDDDRLGTIVGYDETTARLTVSSDTLGRVSFVLTEDSEIKAKVSDHADGSDDAALTPADLRPGLVVAEVSVDEATGVVREIEVYLP